MKTGFLITARLKSTRLPGKLLREIAGRPILAHMIQRIKLARRIDTIVICTSTNAQDDGLEQLARDEGVECFRGDENDVIKRLSDCATALGLNYVVNITADCPFVDPIYVDRTIESFQASGGDLIRSLQLPHGAYCYGIKPESLERVVQIKDAVDTEVWGGYFTDTDLFRVVDLPVDAHHRQPQLRMTLDYPEDLQFFEAVFAALHRPNGHFSLDEILEFLSAHPEVVDLNRHCGSAYRKRWRRQSKIALKQRYPVRRAAVVGCGSIGRRHIQNLQQCGVHEIVALRTRLGHSQQLDASLGVREVESWEELLQSRPDVAVISNPTSLHVEAATRLLSHVRGLFIEKPVAESMAGGQRLVADAADRRIVTFVGYNLLFHPLVIAAQAALDDQGLGNPVVFQCQVGHWLPDWHPYEDYRGLYAARPELGGGALLTLSHEVNLAAHLLGPVNAVFARLGGTATLPLPVETVADLTIEHVSGAVSQIHLDFVQRPLRRCGTISCERGWLAYDLTTARLTAQDDKEERPREVWADQTFATSSTYLDEMRTFLQYVGEGRLRHEYDMWHGMETQAILVAAQASGQSRRLEPVPALDVSMGS